MSVLMCFLIFTATGVGYDEISGIMSFRSQILPLYFSLNSNFTLYKFIVDSIVQPIAMSASKVINSCRSFLEYVVQHLIILVEG